MSTLTFAASVNPILYERATPVFVDSDEHSWNMDSELFVEALEERAKGGRVPKAVVLVHLYGQSADIDPIQQACDRHGVILTTLTIDPEEFGADREEARLALEAANIESRAVWKPIHLQPVYSQYEVIGGGVAENLFRNGLCLPSGSQLTEGELTRVVEVIQGTFRG